ncbi:MAG: SDR family NAD(P)-dependent oxidoreductase, partial [Bacteroidota bacterium]
MIHNYLTNTVGRYASKWLVLCIDIAIVAISFTLSYLIRFNLTFNFEVDRLFVQIPIVVSLFSSAFLILGSYKGVVRHTGVRDVYNIFNAVCLASILTIFVVIANREFQFADNFTIPLSIIIINSLISFLSLVASRYLFKIFLLNLLKDNRPNTAKNILIYGAGESGILTYGAITNLSKSNVKVVGYVDRDNKKIGKLINGVTVYSPRILNEEFILKKGISEVIFCIQNISSKKLKELVEGLVDFPVVVKIVPPVEDWINGELKASQIKNVEIEDLLNREPIDIINSKITDELKGKTVMVTGGAGSIGSEIVRQICNYDYKSLIILDQAESALYDLQQELKQKGFHNFTPIVGDVRDKKRINILFEEHQPEIVFHAAAYKHVPLMEQNAYEAIKINISGTKNIADLSLSHNIDKFVLVSTDKAVNPTNVMGASKRIAEIYVSCMQ